MNRPIRFLFGGWARLAGWAALLIVLLVQIFAGWVFDAPRFALFDFYARVASRLKHGDPILIVVADDASVKALGQWPWPRQVEARLIAGILSAHPAALGLDIIYPEPDRLSPEQWLKVAGTVPPTLRQSLRKLPAHDSILADVLKSGPVVVGIGGRRGAHEPDNGPLVPFRVIGHGAAATPPGSLPGFDAALRSIPILDNAAPGHGVLSADPDRDGVYRRMPLIVSLSGRIAPSLGLELLRIVAKQPWIDLYVDRAAVQAVGLGTLRIPTEADGSVWVDFSPHDPARFVSAVDVFFGRVDRERIARHIVLFAESATGTNDWQQTPVGRMPGTEVHAQILENMLTGKLAGRPYFALTAELLLTFVLAIIQIVSLPRLRLRGQAAVMVLELAGLGATGLLFWSRWLLLIDVATPAIGQILVFSALLGGNFAEANAQRRRLRHELEESRLNAARVEGELKAGHNIQRAMLPEVASVADERVELAPLMVPARQVGGDLYEFFKIDEDRLFFATADVSGKGVPAALFMALGKSVCKSCALRSGDDIGEIINRTNLEIARDNREMMFIAMLAGILDLSTGELQFCNAGSEEPFVLRVGAPPATLTTRGGPPLCIDEDYRYSAERFQLERGGMLCLMTDGVAEAKNAEGKFLGRSAVKIVLAETDCSASALLVTERLRAAVEHFAAGAEAADDVTILTLRWRGAD